MVTFNPDENAFRSVLFTADVKITFQANNWWVDIRTNIHVCSDQSLFSTYQVSGRGTVTMDNNIVAPIFEVDRINLKVTFEKTLTLQDGHYVPKIRRKLLVDLYKSNKTISLYLNQIKL